MKSATSNLKILCLIAASTYLTACNIENTDTTPELVVEESPDFDNDGITNDADTDDDNDSVLDADDAFPLDANESIDSDNDGIGNNADTDDDNDRVFDADDAFPLDANESLDSDNDGIGNNTDTDDDNDSVLDPDDAFPLDATESLDSDNDGIGNNADTDDDNDSVLDPEDAFPLDATESIDSDNDGIGNNADTDDDNDSVLDTDDAFPLDNTENLDTDGDGIGNNSDADPDGDAFYGENIFYSFESEQDTPTLEVSAEASEGWQITNSNSVDGSYSLQASNVNDNQLAIVSLTIDVVDSPALFDFKYAVSSEEDYDILSFFIDDEQIFQSSGEIDWQSFKKHLAVGSYQIRWSYQKDESDHEGEDSAWIDNISLVYDNCPFNANPQQKDLDLDGLGDACDDDIDNDGYENDEDAFEYDPTENLDTDLDGIGNNLDNDDDGDSIPDLFENRFEYLDSLIDDANDDQDGDMFSNAQEYFAASSLNDVQSVPANSHLRKYLADLTTVQSSVYSHAIALDENTMMVAKRSEDNNNQSVINVFQYQQHIWQLTSSINLDMRVSEIAVKNNIAVFSAPSDDTLAKNSGKALVYELIEGLWQPVATLLPNEEDNEDIKLGSAIAIGGTQIFIGAYGDQLGLENHRNTGSVFVFEKQDNDWVYHCKLTASDYAPTASFGSVLSLEDDTLVVSATGTSYPKVYTFSADEQLNWSEQNTLTVNSSEAALFGRSIQLFNQKLYVSVPSADKNSILTNSGAVNIYTENSDGNWVLSDTAHNPAPQTGDQFGYSLTTNGQTLMVSDLPANNILSSVYTLNVNAYADWVTTYSINPAQQQSIDGFGQTLLSNQNYLFISAAGDSDQANRSGAFYIYDNLPLDTDSDGIVDKIDNCPNLANTDQANGNGDVSGDACDGFLADINLQRIVANDGYDDDYFGANFSVFNNTMIVGATDNQSAYIFKNYGGTWTQQQQIQNLDAAYGFGAGVAINDEFALIGTVGSSSSVVEVFKYSQDSLSWLAHSTIDPELGPSTGFGNKITVWHDYAFISAHRTNSSAGAVYVYKLTNNQWRLNQTLSYEGGETSDFFGMTVTVNEHALAIGAPGAEEHGMVLVFELDDNGQWQRVRRIRPSDGEDGDFFGRSLSLSGTQLLIGAPRHNSVGAAYIIDIQTWQEQKLRSDSPIQFESFGWGLAIQDEQIAVGGIYDSVNGIESGSVYLYRLIENQWQQVNKLAPPSDFSAVDDTFGIHLQFTQSQLIIGMDTEDGFNRGAIYIKDLDE